MVQTIKKQLRIYLPALLAIVFLGAAAWLFEPWNWIPGNAIHLNDVQNEIDILRHRLILARLVAFSAVLLASGYTVTQGIMFEKERAQMERKLKNLSRTDSLTGALNRRHFWHTADKELQRHHRYFRELAMLVMDIDHFKRINETFGHSAGDKVLREMVKSSVDNLRKSDIFGRIGGEKFAVLLVETRSEAAIEVADRLRQQLAAKQTLVDGGVPITFTVSIGVTHARREDECVDDLISRADAALVDAKKKGRNRVETSDRL